MTISEQGAPTSPIGVTAGAAQEVHKARAPRPSVCRRWYSLQHVSDRRRCPHRFRRRNFHSPVDCELPRNQRQICRTDFSLVLVDSNVCGTLLGGTCGSRCAPAKERPNRTASEGAAFLTNSHNFIYVNLQAVIILWV